MAGTPIKRMKDAAFAVSARPARAAKRPAELTLPTPEQARFLERVSFGDTALEAAKYSQIDRVTVEDWKADPSFMYRLGLALEDAADLLEAEAVRRARDGFEKGVYHKGEKVDTETQYSDSLMVFLLKGRRNAVFGDRVDVNADVRHTSILTVLHALPAVRRALEGAKDVPAIEGEATPVDDGEGVGR